MIGMEEWMRSLHCDCVTGLFVVWGTKWQATPVFLPGESHGQRSLVGYRPWGCKESDTTEQLTHIEYGRENYRICHKVCHVGIHNFGSSNLFPVRREL